MKVTTAGTRVKTASESYYCQYKEVNTAQVEISQEDVNQKLLRSLSPEWNTHVVVWRNKANMDTMSMDDLYNNLKAYKTEVKGMSSSNSNTQNMAFLSSTNSSTNAGVNTAQAVNTANKVSTASNQVNAAFSTNIDNLSDAVICAFLASQPNSPQLAHEDLEQIHPNDIEEMDLRWQMAMSVLVETPAFIVLVSCDGLGGYDWSDQAEEGPNYALMAYTSSISDSKIVYNCKKGLGYESYNVVPPPYTGNFMPPKLDLSYTGLDEFVVKPIVENKSSEEETKQVRKNHDALIVEDWVSDDEEENIAQPKIVNKTVKPSIPKIEFVKPRQQEKTARKNVKKVEHNRQNIHKPRGNQRNYNNMMSQKLGSNFEMFNKACYKTPKDGNHRKRTPTLSFIRPFRCPVTILNTKDPLGKFDGKADEGFFVGYSLNNKAFSVFNSRTRIVEENLHIRFSENTSNVVGSGPDWLFDIDAVTRTMNYEPIIAGTQSNGFASTKASDNADQKKQDNVNNSNTVNAAITNKVNVVGENISIELPFDPNVPAWEYTGTFNFSNEDEDDDEVAT
uniref:Ribonuclease H-like domain-containing protein n=1 Tax=Tanacetum cinerariifolium TaxID=118510 RepID=A0A6L2LLQ7_TANCI|nr:ribonuclease H-like domain-containing protein [Tanacetum cinerariifolium]